MKKIKYSAIAYCSSQKSALTGQPGFGVRSYTNGFDTNICDYLSADRDVNDNPQTKAYGYELPDDRKLLFADIDSNADVVKDYPVSYTYKTLLTPSKTYYVLARTVYIGIDYGYFCGIENARRVGANYYSHILLFDEMPPKEVFAILIENNYFQNNAFLPLDYRCSPDNQELTQLITGEPLFLPSDEFCIDNQLSAIDDVSDNDSALVIGILQLYINRKLGVTDKRIIVKVPHKEAARLIGFLKTQLPSYLVNDISFQTNYNKSGTPKDIDIIFVNEYYFGGDLYESDHICIDLFSQQHIGIDNNYIYDRVKEMVASKDLETLILFLDYLAGVEISSNTDYEFAYKLFILAKSHNELAIHNLTLSFIDKLKTFRLSQSDNAVVWGKINKTINNAILSRDNSQVTSALKLIGHIGNSKNISISDESKTVFTKHIFDIPNNFGELVSNDNVGITLGLISKKEVQNSERLFYSLNTILNSVVWDNYIRLCFPANEIEKRSSLIIKEIISAGFDDEERYTVLDMLYKSNMLPVINYITERPDSIIVLKKTVEQICSNQINIITQFITAAHNDKNALSILSSISQRYFERKLSSHSNCIKEIQEYITFANAITIQTANIIGASEMIDKYSNALCNTPSVKSKDIIVKLLESGFEVSNKSKKKLDNLLSIICGKLPDNVEEQLMNTAYQLDKYDLLPQMFEMWLKTDISTDSLKHYINNATSLQTDSAFIEHMIMTIWKSRVSQIKNSRDKYVLVVIDNVKWTQKEYKNFLQNCDDQKLVAFLSKSSSFVNKILRKLFKF